MKIVIVSDIHGNYDALLHLPESYDELWVLGDLVNYGPEPREVINHIRRHARYAVRGNHDHSIGFGEALPCPPRLQEMAEATREYTQAVLDEDDLEYLRSLPLHAEVCVGKIHCRLCHALPSNPLFAYHPQSSEWEQECRRVNADVLLIARGHVPFATEVGSTLLVNPGSLGQPRSGEPVASYAVLKDGKLSLRSFHYPINLTTEKIRRLPISAAIRSELMGILRTGVIPSQRTHGITVSSIASN